METETKTKKVDPRGTKRSQALPGTRGNVFHTPLGSIMLVENDSDLLYDPRIKEPISDEFVKSIEEDDVQIPILVAKVDRFPLPIIIDGKQRWRAACIVSRSSMRRSIHSIPAILVKGDDRALFALMILTNENRREDTQQAKCDKVRRFVELYIGPNAGISDKNRMEECLKQAAVTFGVTTKTITARLAFTELNQKVQDAVANNEIGFWAATELSSLPYEEQEKKLDEVIATSKETGKRPSIEGAKRAAGKGDSKKRQALEEAKKTLLEIAVEYGQKPKSRDSLERLKTASLMYFDAFKKKESS